MAESLVSILLPKLTTFIENVSQYRDEVIAVRSELERIGAFLRVADSLEETDEEVKVWVKQIRDIAYDTEDALDELRLLVGHDHEAGPSSIPGLLQRMSCCVLNFKSRYRIANELRRVNERLKSVCEGHRRLRSKFTRAEQRGNPSGDGDGNWQDHRGNALLIDKADLVGIEEPKKQFVEWLVNGGPDRKVVSVVGMGGLGKTTLVKQVFEDPTVKKHFAVSVWITLSRSSDIEVLLKELLLQLTDQVIRKPVPPGAHAMNGHWLKIVIKDLLQRRRYLIVLDDAWHTSEWDAVKHALPNNSYGSRVMITTRYSELASTACKEFTGNVHTMEPLTSEQSWKLFCKKTFPGKNLCPSHLEDICKYILRKCDGLPLAIVAISGVLATKDKRRVDEWDLVRRSLRAEIDGNNRLHNLKRVLSLSLNDLPYYLKSCFLHLSVFPEGHIDRKRLIRLWVAEGFIERKEGKLPEEIADEYFNELLSRSLLQEAEPTTDGRVKVCRVHDILREIITLKSKEHGFTNVVKDPGDIWPDKVRRLSIQNTLESFQSNKSLSQLRSLYMFGADKTSVCAILGSTSKLLGVLDLQAATITRFPTQVLDSYYLKYLSLRYTEVKMLPKSIGKLQNLETLDLKHTNITELPVEILKLQKLRHLLVYRYENISYLHYKYGFKSLSGIGALQSLQKLCYMEVDDERSDVIMKEIGKLSQLSRLGILKLRKEDGRDLCIAIAKLANLQALSVATVEDDEIIDLQHLVSPPQFLQRIYLRGRLETLPNWMCSLHSLMKLNLRWSRLKEDPLMHLQKLPNLVHLEMLQVYDGKTLFFKAKGFKRLRIIGLDNFEELRCIEIEEGAMPCLEKLIIQRCKLLEKIPSGIEYLTKLKVLEFFDMPDELVKVMRDEQGEEYKKVAHIPQVFYGYWRDGGWDVQSVERYAEGDCSPRPGTSMRSNNLPPCWK